MVSTQVNPLVMNIVAQNGSSHTYNNNNCIFVRFSGQRRAEQSDLTISAFAISKWSKLIHSLSRSRAAKVVGNVFVVLALALVALVLVRILVLVFSLSVFSSFLSSFIIS